MTLLPVGRQGFYADDEDNADRFNKKINPVLIFMAGLFYYFLFKLFIKFYYSLNLKMLFNTE